jgi:hypothetical protein
MAQELKESLSNRDGYCCITPILLIGFNRPDTLIEVFNHVKCVNPLKLYIAIDGPRFAKGKQEKELVTQCRSIINQIDWQCELHTLFREQNKGCGYGPSEAISWAFENEDRLIVLEDDCVPSQSFFQFCDEMLECYKDDKRVNIISGRSHHQGSKFFDNQDYIFTHYAHTWGWATWKRAWEQFDMKMTDFPEFKKIGGASNVLFSKEESAHFNKWFESIYDNIEQECTHSWDAQWVYARLKSGALGIVPAKNLIQNIGEFGTHSSGHQATFDLQAEELPDELHHPMYVLPNREYENMHFHNHIHVVTPLYKRIYHRIQRWIK